MAGLPVDRMFRALSDPTRLRILHLLRGGELCVCDLVEILRIPQPTASRHVAYLRTAGLLTGRQSGYWTHYSLAHPKSAFHKKLLDCLDSCFGEVPALSSDAARAKAVRAKGGCCTR